MCICVVIVIQLGKQMMHNCNKQINKQNNELVI